jgi:predicted Zn-dependent protease
VTRAATPHRRTLILCLAAVLACTINPATGEREILIMSPAEEEAAGREAAAQVAREIGLLEDARLEEYVAAIGARLAEHSPRQDVQYRFSIVAMPEVNAFALPGGHVYVSRGLLALANSEDELANVLAHEVAHVAARHHAQRQTRAAGVGIISVLGAVLAGAVGGSEAAGAVAQIGQVAGAGLIASYSRDQERQSDRIGQRIAAEAGWDPAAMAEFLRSLEREGRLRQGEARQPSFLDTHPSTPERVSSAVGVARAIPATEARPIAESPADFLALLEGLPFGQDPAEGIFRDSVFLHPDLHFQIRFPSDWAVRNARDAVGAVAPEGTAVNRLVAQEEGSDPRGAAERFAAKERVRLVEPGPLRIGSLRAYHAQAEAAGQGGQSVFVDLTWVAHRNLVFRIDGMASAGDFSRYSELFRRTARSFRPLTPEEHSSITRRLVHIVTAREGEMLEALSVRTANAWSLEETSVMNSIHETERLRAAQPVKIAREHPLARAD